MRRRTFAVAVAAVLSVAAPSRASLTPSEAEQVRRGVATASDLGRVRALVARPDLSSDEAAAAMIAPLTDHGPRRGARLVPARPRVRGRVGGVASGARGGAGARRPGARRRRDRAARARSRPGAGGAGGARARVRVVEQVAAAGAGGERAGVARGPVRARPRRPPRPQRRGATRRRSRSARRSPAHARRPPSRCSTSCPTRRRAGSTRRTGSG